MTPMSAEQMEAHLARIKEAAKEYGFFQPYPITKPHIFNHRLVPDHDWDFSAVNPDKLIEYAWKDV